MSGPSKDAPRRATAAKANEAPPPTFDPVELAESLAAAAEKSGKLIGEFATRSISSDGAIRFAA